ncbi:MAG: flippase [Thermodesulfobacteriota bacterium]
MTETPNERKNLLKDASWLFSGEMGRSLFAGLETVLLARLLGLEQFGLLALVIAFVNIINGLIDFNVTESVVKYVGQYRERKDKEKTLSFVKLFYLIDFFSGIVAFAVAILLAGVANEFFIKSENAFELIFIYSFYLLVVTVNNNSKSLFTVFQRFNMAALLDVVGVGIRFVFVAITLLMGFGVKGALFAYVAAGFIHFVILQFFVNRALKDEGLSGWLFAKLGDVKDEFRGVASFILNSTVASFISKVFDKNFPILILGNLFGNEVSGLYKTAAVVSKIIGKLVMPATKVLYPALVRLEERQSYNDFRYIVSYSMKLLAMLVVPVSAICFLFAADIIRIFFGAEYVGAANAMKIIVVAELLFGITFWVPSVLLALGMVWFRTGLALVGTLLYVVALFILAPIYSLEGVAFAKLVPFLPVLFVALFLFREMKKRGRAVA